MKFLVISLDPRLTIFPPSVGFTPRKFKSILQIKEIHENRFNPVWTESLTGYNDMIML